METSLTLLFGLTVAAFFSSVISALVGMAGGIVLLSIMTFFMDLSIIVPIHGVVQFASNGTRSFSLWHHVDRRIVIPTLIGMPIGVIVATQIIKSIDNREVLYFLIAALIFYVLFKPRRMPSLKIPFWGFGILAVLVGIFNPLIGATGPLMAPFFLRDDLSKEAIVATKATVQTYGHILKVPAFLYLGFDYGAHAVLIIIMVIAVITGTRYGVGLLHRLSESRFRLIFKVALFIAACRVTYKGIESLGWG